jgi:hypothetical protein
MDIFTDKPHWTGGCAPLIYSILYHEPGLVRFHGDCYREPETLPVERVLTTAEGEFHVELTRLTVTDGEDERDNELHYRVIATLNPSEAAATRQRCLTLLPAEDRRDRWHRQQRKWEEWQFAVQLDRNLTFTPGPVDPAPALMPSRLDLQDIESHHHHHQCDHRGDGCACHET